MKRFSTESIQQLMLIGLLLINTAGWAQSFDATDLPTGLYTGGIDWGDYDNDGDLDLVAGGIQTGGTFTTLIYRNDNGIFSNSGQSLMGCGHGNVRWGDCDGDNDLDLLIASSSGSYVYLNDGWGNLRVTGGMLLATGATGNGDWGDYDNDGDLDILLGGGQNYGVALYRNDGSNVFTLMPSNITPPRITGAHAWWGDCDRDGDLDILTYGNSSGSAGLADIYIQSQGRFTRLNSNLPKLYDGSYCWADMDNDGYLDVIANGCQAEGSTNYTCYVYRNNKNNTFSAQSRYQLSGTRSGTVSAIDYNNDGYEDLMLTGQAGSDIISKLYSNNVNQGFNSPLVFTGLEDGEVAWGDYNNDGRIDFAYTGNTTSNEVLKSTCFTQQTVGRVNNIPKTPTTQPASVNGNTVTLRWSTSAPIDTETPDAAITYNVWIRNISSGQYVVSPMANLATGKRAIQRRGNVGTRTNLTITLPNGAYRWSVQAIDAAMGASAFASTTGELFLADSNEDHFYVDATGATAICGSGSAPLQVVPAGTGYQWKKDGAAAPGNNTSQQYSATTGGNYYVLVNNNRGQQVQSVNGVNITSGAVPGSAIVTNTSVCPNIATRLTASPGANANTCRWYTSATGGSWVAQDIAYQTTISGPTTYYVSSYSTTSECESSSRTPLYVQVLTPPGLPVTSGSVSSCQPGLFHLTATPDVPANSVGWFANSTTPTPFRIAQSLDTVVRQTTTFYPRTIGGNGCLSAPAPLTVTISNQPGLPQVNDVITCTAAAMTLTATPVGATSCRWYASATGDSVLGTGTTYRTPALTHTFTYYVTSWNPTLHCESGRQPLTVCVNLIDGAPQTENVTRYGSSSTRVSVTLYAVPPTGATICRWYSDAQLTRMVFEGNAYQTPLLSATTTYWVRGYNSTFNCSGPAAQVQAIISPVPTVTPNPDYIFNIPQNRGTRQFNGVNLFTGDVNESITLATISSELVSYELTARYNSRSVGFSPLVTTNSLRGLGWKLGDYPKIAYDNNSNTYWLLMPDRKYQLDTVSTSTTSHTMEMAADEDFHLWRIICTRTDENISARRWLILREDGTRYAFNSTAASVTEGGLTPKIWSISTISDAQKRDSLQFFYEGAKLARITSANDDKLELTYASNYNYITSLTHYGISNTASGWPQAQVVLTYRSGFPLSSSLQALYSIQSFVNQKQPTATSTTTGSYLAEAPANIFTYDTTSYPGALCAWRTPTGAVKSYVYGVVPTNGPLYTPVLQLNTTTGTTHTYEGKPIAEHTAFSFQYKGLQPSADGAYAQYNECVVLPGVDRVASIFRESSTSFESSKGDPLFGTIDSDDLSTDYALSGSKSFKFDAEVWSFTHNRELESQTLMLTKAARMLSANSAVVKYKGPQDSVSISFFCYDKHESLDVEVYLDVYFYDSTGHQLAHLDSTFVIDDDNYGKWVSCRGRFAVPQNTSSFKFKFSGGEPIQSHDFYIDNVSVDGASYERQGASVYHFFTGAPRQRLAHLPDEYAQSLSQEKILSAKYTGFEFGDNYESWISHDNDCKPKQTENSSSKLVAYNGSYAYRLHACDSGNKSKIYGTLNVPSGCNRILVGFNYSHPQLPGLSFRLRLTQGSTTRDTTITTSGSYFTDSSYAYCQRLITVGSTHDDFSFELKITSAGGSNVKVNDFFIDDFTVIFLQDQQAQPTLAPLVDVTNPLLTGNAYHIRVLTNSQHELESNEFVFKPIQARHAPDYLQLTDTRGANRGAQLAGNQSTYSTAGQVKKMVSGWNRTTTDGQQVPVSNRMEVIYASQIWSKLNAGNLHLLDETALTLNSVKNGPDSAWAYSSGQLVQWKQFTGLSTTNGGQSSLWAPWRTFTLIGATTSDDVEAVLAGIASASYTPPANIWRLDRTVVSLDGMGNVLEEVVQDTLHRVQLLSRRTYTDANNHTLRRGLQTTASFTHATTGSVYYNGFELYESAAFTSSGAYNTAYANTGERCARTANLLSIAFHRPTRSTNQYQVGFYLMLTTSSTTSVRLRVTNHATGAALLNTTYSLSGNQWRYLEAPLTIADTTATLDVMIDNGNGSSIGYFDDFRLAPRQASFSCSVYDMDTQTITADIDNNSNVQRTLTNALGQAIAQVGPAQPTAITTAFLSRTTASTNTYSPNDPNSTTQLVARGASTAFNWGDKDHQQQWTQTGVTFSPTKASFFASSYGSANMVLKSSYLPAKTTDWGLSMKLNAVCNSLMSGAQYFTIDFGNTGVRLKYTYSSSGSTGSTCSLQTETSGSWSTKATIPATLTASGACTQDLQVFFAGSRMLLWLNGHLIANTLNISTSSINRVKLMTSSGSVYSTVEVSNLILVNDPLISLVFSDGAGNPIQQQFVSGNDLLLTETLYDAMQRPEIATKAVKLANTAPGYNADFITSFDWSSGKIKGTVTQAANYIANGSDDANYVYSRTVYHQEPDVSPSFAFNAGKDFVLRDRTNWEKAQRWMYSDFPKYVNDAITIIGYTLDAIDCITEPEMAPLIIGMDAGGLILSHIMSSKDNNVAEVPVTKMTYDGRRNLETVSLPLANRKSHAQPAQVVRYSYNFQNQLLQRQSPEAGKTHYAYDKWGHARFAQTEDNKTAGIVQYFKYDGYGRMIEIGYLTMSWDQTYLNTKANIPGFPTGSSVVVTHVNHYDGAGTDSAGYAPKRGYLTGRSTRATDGTTTVETFQYDPRGNIKSVSTNVTPSAVTYTVSYGYDQLNNVVQTTYPAYNGEAFVVTQTYDKLNNPVSIGTPSSPKAYAAYTWNPDGSVAGSSIYGTGHKLHNFYSYNAPTWTTSIAARDSVGSQVNLILDDAYNYNFIDDWWAKLWGQKYYNGNLAQNTYSSYNSYNVYAPNQKGFVYDSLGRLATAFNSIKDNPFQDGGTKDHPWNDTYDLNGNLVRHLRAHVVTGMGGDTLLRRYVQDPARNLLKNVIYHEHHDVGGVFHYKYDTLYATASKSGFFTSLKYRGHARSTNELHQVGVLDSTSLRTLVFNTDGLLESATWNTTGLSSGSMKIYYDGQGDRMRKMSTSGSTTTTTTYVRGQSTTPLLEVVQSGTTTTYNYYVFGPDGLLTLVRKSSDTTLGGSWAIIKDRQGSVQQLVNRSNGHTDLQLHYDDYGIVYPEGSIAFSYYFTGQEYDAETQLYNYHARMYDPWLRQFLSPDPAHQDLGNPYAYTSYDPVNRVDPDGRVNFLSANVLGATAADMERARRLYEGVSLDHMINDVPIGRSRPVRNRDWKLEFSRRLNDASPEVIAELKYYKMMSASNPTWGRIKDILRPGGMHEFFNVAGVADWLQRGIQVNDIQRYTVETTLTEFVDLTTPAIAHAHTGTSVSSYAHREVNEFLREVQPPLVRTNTSLKEARIEMIDKARDWTNRSLMNQRYAFTPRTQTKFNRLFNNLGKRVIDQYGEEQRVKRAMLVWEL